MYFVPNSGSAPNQYDEYIWVNNAWEKLGTQSIDLSNYIQKSNTSGLVKNDGTIDTTNYQPILGYYDFIVGNKIVKKSYNLKIDGNTTLVYSPQMSGSNLRFLWFNIPTAPSNLRYNGHSVLAFCNSNYNVMSVADMVSWSSFMTGDNANKCFVAKEDNGKIYITLPKAKIDDNTITDETTARAYLNDHPCYVSFEMDTLGATIEDI